MDEQFKVDVPRLIFFVDEEWVPSSDPEEVWQRILTEYDNEVKVAESATKCFKQSFLSDYYIHELADINFVGSDEGSENLLSHNSYKVSINTMSGYITVTKDFIHSVVLDGDVYNIDYCVLTIVYDPYADKEISCNWHYTIENMRERVANKRSQILSREPGDLFEV